MHGILLEGKDGVRILLFLGIFKPWRMEVSRLLWLKDMKISVMIRTYLAFGELRYS